MLYSLVVMIGDGKGSFWCGTEGEDKIDTLK